MLTLTPTCDVCTLKMQAHAIGARKHIPWLHMSVHWQERVYTVTCSRLCLLQQCCFDGLLMGLQSLFSVVLGPASLWVILGLQFPLNLLGKNPTQEEAYPLAAPEKDSMSVSGSSCLLFEVSFQGGFSLRIWYFSKSSC